MKLSEISKLIEKEALKESSEIKVPNKDELYSSITITALVGLLTYFLGLNTDVFVDGWQIAEVPLYLTYGGLVYLAKNNLESICGKPSLKQIAGKVTAGIGAGGSAGVGLASVFFQATGDIIATVAGALIGGVGGFFVHQKGKKTHKCGKELNCQTWVCTKCKKLVKPTKEWKEKDRWNLLDVCDYLDTGGYSMNTIKALAFMYYSKLLIKEKFMYGDNPTKWKPKDVKNIADKKSDEFNEKFTKFLRANKINLSSEILELDELFNGWAKFLNKKTVANNGYK